MTRKLAILFSILLVMGLTAACSSAGGFAGIANRPIEPGDKIGDFLITTGEPGKFIYGFAIDCSEPGIDSTYICDVTAGDVINVSTGVYDTTGNGSTISGFIPTTRCSSMIASGSGSRNDRFMTPATGDDPFGKCDYDQ
jgi:hypothetical protein